MTVTIYATASESFALKAGETLLEGLERNGYPVEYQCRQGYCGACRMRIAEGEVHYRDKPLAYVARGEVLACCALPQSNIVLMYTFAEEEISS